MPKKYPTSLGKLRVKQLSAKTLLKKFVEATEDYAFRGHKDPADFDEIVLWFNVMQQEVRRRLNAFDVMRRAEAGKPRPALDYYPDPQG